MSDTRTKEIYEMLCSALDAREWRYNRIDEKNAVFYGVNTEDLPMEFTIAVEGESVRLFSALTTKFDEDKRMDGCIATNFANSKLADGCFDFDLSNGSILFRMNHSLRGGCIPNNDFFYYIIDFASFAVDEYNDRFLALSKGYVSIQDFLTKADN